VQVSKESEDLLPNLLLDVEVLKLRERLPVLHKRVQLLLDTSQEVGSSCLQKQNLVIVVFVVR